MGVTQVGIRGKEQCEPIQGMRRAVRGDCQWPARLGVGGRGLEATVEGKAVAIR